MNYEPILLYNNYIKDKFLLRLVCKEWLNIIIYTVFKYNIKYKFRKKINYLKNKYKNIQICCNSVPLDTICVSDLKDIHTLNIKTSICMSQVENISDISMLGNLHTLDMNYCNNIKDISMLGNLYTLDIENCYNIVKYPEPNNIVEYYK
jgi:hypothetical protein